jgi:hypothetical protein
MVHRLVCRWDSLNLKSYQTLLMGTHIVPELLIIFNQLIWLIAQEYFINFSDHESFGHALA